MGFVVRLAGQADPLDLRTCISELEDPAEQCADYESASNLLPCSFPYGTDCPTCELRTIRHVGAKPVVTIGTSVRALSRRFVFFRELAATGQDRDTKLRTHRRVSTLPLAMNFARAHSIRAHRRPAFTTTTTF